MMIDENCEVCGNHAGVEIQIGFLRRGPENNLYLVPEQVTHQFRDTVKLIEGILRGSEAYKATLQSFQDDWKSYQVDDLSDLRIYMDGWW